jgi:hypothetical protein
MNIDSAFGAEGRGPGRPAKVSALSHGGRRRRKGPKELCPVPGCENSAAPVFGMVCEKHRDVPKAKIAKYREARASDEI